MEEQNEFCSNAGISAGSVELTGALGGQYKTSTAADDDTEGGSPEEGIGSVITSDYWIIQ